MKKLFAILFLFALMAGSCTKEYKNPTNTGNNTGGNNGGNNGGGGGSGGNGVTAGRSGRTGSAGGVTDSFCANEVKEEKQNVVAKINCKSFINCFFI